MATVLDEPQRLGAVNRWTGRPGLILGAIFVVSAAARVVVGTLRPTPLYYPDEYIYTALARSIASTGIPGIRGANWDFPSVLGPYLMAPAWWFSDVRLAYHVVLGLGAVWFSVAACPAYLLARRIGVSTRGALVVALFAVLVPDAVFTSVALTEPYAYPLFLTTVLVAVDAIALPTTRRQVGVLLLTGVLCLARVQFVVLPIAYLAAAVVHNRGVRRTLRAQSIVVAALLAGAALVIAAGPGRVGGYYSHYLTRELHISSLWRWFGLDLFVLLIAAGWAIVPSAALGLVSLVRSRDPRSRVGAVLILCATFVLLAEATHFASVSSRTYERYVFYVAPLLVIPAVWAVERRLVSRAYPFVAYALAAAAIVVPATDALHSSSTGQSPSLLWLRTLGNGGTSAASLVWAIGLALVAVAVAQLRTRPAAALVLGVIVTVAVSTQATRAFLRFVPLEQRAARSRSLAAFQLGAPTGSALVTWSGTDQFILMKTLFWSPRVHRVVVVGGGEASDGFASTSVGLGATGGIVDASGRAVQGPFAFPLDATVAAPGSPAWVRRWPAALIFGLDRVDQLLSPAAQLLVSAGPRPRRVDLALVASSPRTLTIVCPSRRIDVRFGGGRRHVRLPVPSSQTLSCRISLTRGAALQHASGVTSGVRVLRFSVVPA